MSTSGWGLILCSGTTCSRFNRRDLPRKLQDRTSLCGVDSIRHRSTFLPLEIQFPLFFFFSTACGVDGVGTSSTTSATHDAFRKNSSRRSSTRTRVSSLLSTAACIVFGSYLSRLIFYVARCFCLLLCWFVSVQFCIFLNVEK